MEHRLNETYRYLPQKAREINANTILRVAAYCRVSTDKEEQEGSYEMQERYFTDLINSNHHMKLVGIYGDKGKSGLKTVGRPGLLKLMEDCRMGRIDLVLTKSISRFARNMSDCAELIRELRSLGVDVHFEKENVNSRSTGCDLILNIFSAIAQEESNSISQNSIRSHEQYTLEGRPFGRVAFGYYNAGENRWEINEEEAERVRAAFRMAGQGQCYSEILKALDEMETDGYRWKQKRLKNMLTNPAYKGDYYSHGTVCLVPGKPIPNRGYRDRFYITGHHKAIVTAEEWERVQEIVQRGILVSYKKPSEEDLAFLRNLDTLGAETEGGAQDGNYEHQ